VLPRFGTTKNAISKLRPGHRKKLAKGACKGACKGYSLRILVNGDGVAVGRGGAVSSGRGPLFQPEPRWYFLSGFKARPWTV
jgi:hypothetical protein